MNAAMNTDWIGTWIREARRYWGKSQETLGEAMGLTKGNVSAWENNRHQPSIQQLTRVSELTRYPLPEELIQHLPGGAKTQVIINEEEIKEITRKHLSDQALEVAKAFDKLKSPSQKYAVLMQLKAFGAMNF